MKGEVVTHQLDCAVAGSVESTSTSPAFVAAMSVFCSSCAWVPSVSQITRYLVKERLVGRALGGGVAKRNGCAAIHPDKANTSLTRFASAVSKTLSLTPRLELPQLNPESGDACS